MTSLAEWLVSLAEFIVVWEDFLLCREDVGRPLSPYSSGQAAIYIEVGGGTTLAEKTNRPPTI